MSVQQQQVARLVERPIEVVEYQRHSCQCAGCGQVVTAAWTEDMVPGQDLSIGLQALLVWLGNYGHLSYEKQQELICELGQVAIGLGTLQATNSRMAAAAAHSVEALWEWAQQQAHLACHGRQGMALGGNGQGVLREFAGESTLSSEVLRGKIPPQTLRRNTRPVSCWRHSRHR